MAPEKTTLDQLRIDRRAPTRKSPAGLILGLACIALLALALAGWKWVGPAAIPVRTLVVRETGGNGGGKTVLNASGYVVARREATVSSKVTGKVVEVLIEEGMKVVEDQILARLDASNIQASFALAKAQLESARSALNELRIRLDEAGKELRRVSGLASNQVASAADLDHAQAEAKSTQARLERQQVEVTVGERQVALLQQQLDDTVIRAPFAGVITSKNAQPGEMISPISAGGGFTRTGICTIVDMDSLEIEIDVNESFINRVAPGQAVTATLDAYPDWPIPAKVIAIIPTADRQKATIKVRVGFEKLDPKILPQMGIKVGFQGDDSGPSLRRGIAIPKSAVRREEGRDVVWIIRDGRAERRAISTVHSTGDEVLVTAGLTGGERIVIEGSGTLTDGQKVRETNP